MRTSPEPVASNDLVVSVASTVRFSCGCQFETASAKDALAHVLATKHVLTAHGMIGPIERVRNIEPTVSRPVRDTGWSS